MNRHLLFAGLLGSAVAVPYTAAEWTNIVRWTLDAPPAASAAPTAASTGLERDWLEAGDALAATRQETTRLQLNSQAAAAQINAQGVAYPSDSNYRSYGAATVPESNGGGASSNGGSASGGTANQSGSSGKNSRFGGSSKSGNSGSSQEYGNNRSSSTYGSDSASDSDNSSSGNSSSGNYSSNGSSSSYGNSNGYSKNSGTSSYGNNSSAADNAPESGSTYGNSNGNSKSNNYNSNGNSSSSNYGSGNSNSGYGAAATNSGGSNSGYGSSASNSGGSTWSGSSSTSGGNNAAKSELQVDSTVPNPSANEVGLVPMTEALRLDVAAPWVLQRWPRVNTAINDGDFRGFRVPLVTGAGEEDLAGALTYYFDNEHRCRRITFNGTVGDPRPLVAFVVQTYELEPQKSPEPGVHLYQTRWNGKSQRELKVVPSQTVRANTPHLRYRIEMTLNDR